MDQGVLNHSIEHVLFNKGIKTTGWQIGKAGYCKKNHPAELQNFAN